jgi:hypothetical protein
VRRKGIRYGMPVDEPFFYFTSLRTGAKPLLQDASDSLLFENSWLFPRDT